LLPWRRWKVAAVHRRLAAWLLWWIALWWLWMLLAGDWNRTEWVGGACAATIGATVAELCRGLAGVQLRVALERLRASATVLPVVFADFGIVMYALLRSLAARRVVRGRFVVRDFDAGAKTTAAGAARRAWTVLLAGYSPNAYVVDVDPEADEVLLHDLVPWRRSEEPA
jgi:hypothetical protein